MIIQLKDGVRPELILNNFSPPPPFTPYLKIIEKSVRTTPEIQVSIHVSPSKNLNFDYQWQQSTDGKALINIHVLKKKN